MSQFNFLRVGKAGTPYDTTQRPSQDNNLVGIYAYPPAQGCPTTPSWLYNVVPLQKNATNVAASQTPSGAGKLTLAAGTGTTSTTVKGNTVIALDCARCIALIGQGGVAQVNYTITGYDDFQNPMTQVLAGPNGAQTINTTKAFRYVQSISVDGGTSAAITVGTSDIIGLQMCAPYYECAAMNWNGAQIASNANFTAADATSPATTSTGDVRGTVNLGAISATDGTKRFTAEIQLVNPDTVTGAWGVAQV